MINPRVENEVELVPWRNDDYCVTRLCESYFWNLGCDEQKVKMKLNGVRFHTAAKVPLWSDIRRNECNMKMFNYGAAEVDLLGSTIAVTFIRSIRQPRSTKSWRTAFRSWAST